ncbi:MAG TPA: TonB-dependent receptor [Gemmatimonadales bacterium]|nr:TonB-dependent receptor [Gemmatimonadales bacterium]
MDTRTDGRAGYALLTVLALLTSARTAAGQQGVVAGRIVSAASGAAIQGAEILITGLGEQRTTSAGDGRFRVAGVAPGTGIVRVLALGFVPAEASVTVKAGDTTTVELKLTPGVITLPEVVITAPPGPEVSGADLAASTAVLTSQQLDRTPSSAPDDYLRGVPSVQLPLMDAASNFPAQPGFSVRGLGVGDNATRALLLINQRPSNGAFFGNVWWYRVPLQDVDRIELIRGGSSDLFGSYAMAGTIHMRTRPTPAAPTVWVETKGGMLGTFQGDVYGGGRVGPAVRASAGANYTRTDGYILLPDSTRGPIDRSAGAEAVTARGALDFDLSSSATLEVHGDYLKDMRTGSTELSPKDVEVYSAGMSYSHVLAGGAHLAVAADYLHEDFTTDNTSNVVFGDRSAEYLSNRHVTPANDFHASVVYSHPFSARTSVTLGGDARLIDGQDSSDIYTASGFAFRRVGGGKQRSFGLFAQAQWQPTPAVVVSAAARGDFFTNADGFINDTLSQSYPDQSFNEFNPRVGVRWTLSRSARSEVAVRAAGYRAFRAPNLSNLYRSFGTTTFVGLANPELTAETLTGADGGLDVRAGPLGLQVNGFWTEVDHFIGDVVVAFDPFTVHRENVGTLRSQGVELLANALFARAFVAELGFVYTDAKVVESSDPELEGKRGEGAPKTVWTASLGLAPTRGFGFQVRARRLSDQYQDISNELYLPSHFVMDVSASYLSPAGWELYVEGKNILDEEYIAEAESGSLGAPRQILAGARVRLAGR